MFKLVKAAIPHLPDWLFKRPHLNHNSLTRQWQGLAEGTPSAKQPERPKPLGSFPIEMQEAFLLEDLLFAMTSIEGVYIRRSEKGQFAVEPHLQQASCDMSLQFLVNKVLGLCAHHDAVQEFVNLQSQFEFGLVSHALCHAVRVLLKEYLLLVTQLDTEFAKADLTL